MPRTGSVAVAASVLGEFGLYVPITVIVSRSLFEQQSKSQEGSSKRKERFSRPRYLAHYEV